MSVQLSIGRKVPLSLISRAREGGERLLAAEIVLRHSGVPPFLVSELVDHVTVVDYK